MRNDTIKINSGNTLMIAHRGVSGIERENTCPAFLAAGNRSYYGVETDVHVSRDKQFVVIHDESTKRVSLEAVDINVEQSDYAEFKDIVLPDLDGSLVRGDIRIPLLSEYVSICKKYDKKCVLEVKNRFATEDIETMVKQIDALGYIDGMIFISFSWDNCIDLRRLLPDATIQWLTWEDVSADRIEEMVANGFELDIYYKRLNKEAIDLFHSKGIKVNCWTVDDKNDAEALVEMGIDYITTNILE